MKIKKQYREFLRRNINAENRKRLENKDITIFSSNCTGGVLAHDLGLQFLSPTVNMFICPKDFLELMLHLKEYLSYDLREDKNSGKEYPVAVLGGGILLHGLHYPTYELMEKKWEERKRRVNWDNIFVMMFERDGCAYGDLKAFDELPFANKVVFVHKEMPEIHSSYYIPGSELAGDPEHKLTILTKYTGMFSGKRIIDAFDYVTFFNLGSIISS